MIRYNKLIPRRARVLQHVAYGGTNEQRQSGRTTGGLLKMIAMAIEVPGVEVAYRDHYLNEGGGVHVGQTMLGMLRGLIETLGLQHMATRQEGGIVYLRSDIFTTNLREIA